MVESLGLRELRNWQTRNCPPLPRDSADRGGAAGGGVR